MQDTPQMVPVWIGQNSRGEWSYTTQPVEGWKPWQVQHDVLSIWAQRVNAWRAFQDQLKDHATLPDPEPGDFDRTRWAWMTEDALQK